MKNAKAINKLSAYLLLIPLLVTSTALFAERIVDSGEQSAGFRFNEKSSEPLIQYSQHIYMLAGIDDRPTLQVFADGRVVAHYPVYMKKAGDYEMQLDEAELEALIQSLSSNGLMVFDAKKVKEKIKQHKKAEKAKGQFHAISDALESVIEIKLDEYQENSKAKKIEKFHKQFRWKNIEHDAARYKHNSEIIKANNSVTHLKGLMKDKRLLKSGRK